MPATAPQRAGATGCWSPPGGVGVKGREGRGRGWKRKRGKLRELNRLLRGASDTTFLALSPAGPAIPPDVRYVITLDEDTRLPRETGRVLVGAAAHPVPQPVFDPETGRVV